MSDPSPPAALATARSTGRWSPRWSVVSENLKPWSIATPGFFSLCVWVGPPLLFRAVNNTVSMSTVPEPPLPTRLFPLASERPPAVAVSPIKLNVLAGATEPAMSSANVVPPSLVFWEGLLGLRPPQVSQATDMVKPPSFVVAILRVRIKSSPEDVAMNIGFTSVSALMASRNLLATVDALSPAVTRAVIVFVPRKVGGKKYEAAALIVTFALPVPGGTPTTETALEAGDIPEDATPDGSIDKTMFVGSFVAGVFFLSLT